MPKAGDQTHYQGHIVDMLTLQIIMVANYLLRLPKFGGELEDVSMKQGSWNVGVGASAGTHDEGATFDLSPFNWRNRVKVFRLLGVAYFDRPELWQRGKRIWPHHGHGVVVGMGNAAWLALQQVKSFLRGRNGLANDGRDTDWRPMVLPILAVFNGNTGPRVAIKNTQGRSQPSYLATVERKVSLNTRVNVLMEVNVAGKRWSVTNEGDFLPSWKLTAA